VEGDEIGRECIVSVPNITLGRGKDATISLEGDRKVSRNHAQLTTRNGDVYITDLDSSNGTYVDGQFIQERTKLVIGSQIQLGNSLMVVSDIQANSSEAMIKFEQLTDDEMRKEYVATIHEITIGRGLNAQIRLLDSTGKLSRIQVKLEVRKGDVYIIDLNTSNETYVDGEKITGSYKLSIGSKINLGGVAIQILSIES
jgi:pSer/pThr/pTyr-binding forkhead associated (FHA) protein